MRYYIAKQEFVRDKVRIFPFGRFYRGGWREFTAGDAEEMVRNFKAGLPNSSIPVNVEHDIRQGRIGTIDKLWVGEDGVYARIKWTDDGRKLVKAGRFLFFSPEIAWEWINPTTGRKHKNVLVGGAVTNYPFHGDATVLFSRAAQESLDVLQKLAVLDINPRSLRRVSDRELLSLHRRMHQLAVSLRKGSPSAQDVHIERPMDEEEFISVEDVVNAHVMIVSEMRRRGMDHAPEGENNWLDQQSRRLMKSTAARVVRRLASEGEQEVVLIPGFVSIVGSAVKRADPNDLDVLIRAEIEDGYYKLGAQTLWLPLRKFINPHKDRDLPLRWVSNAQGPHDDALIIGDLVLKIRPRFQPVDKEYVEKRVRSFLYFVGTGALESPRRGACLMVVSGRNAVLFDVGDDVQPKHLPRVPDIILLTDPTENRKEAERLARAVGVEIAYGDWEAPDIKVKAFKVKHTGHDVYGYKVFVSDLVIAYVPEFWEFPAEAVRNADIGIFDGSAFDKPIRFAGGKGGHAPVTETLVNAFAANVKRIIFTHVGKPVEENLGMLQAAGVEVAMDGQAVVVKASLEPGRQNFKPLKTGRGYGENEFADPNVAWEVWGRSNVPFAVEEKYDGWRLIVHKRGDQVWAFSEDAKRNLADKLPRLVESVRKLPGNFIMDGELEIYAGEPVRTKNFTYSKGDKIERIDMPSFLSSKKPLAEYRERYFAFDLVYRDGDIHRLPWTERRKALVSLLEERQSDALKLTPTRVVENKQQFLAAARGAFKQPNSEGAMLKNIKAPYALNGETIEWCFPRGYVVPTPDGDRRIEEIGVGDRVFGPDGHPRQVTGCACRHLAGDVVRIRIRNFPDLVVTPEHRVAAWVGGKRERYKERWRNYKRTVGGYPGKLSDAVPEIRFIPAAEISPEDYLVFPVASEGSDGWGFDATYLWLLGFLVAEGWSDYPSRVRFSQNADKDELIARLRDVLAGYFPGRVHEERSGAVLRFTIEDKDFTSFFVEKFGTGAARKRLPQELFCLDEAHIRAFLMGYFDGDGCRSNGQAGTKSYSLALGLQLAATRLGYLPYCNFTGKLWIVGFPPAFFSGGPVWERNDAWQRGDHWFLPVLEVVREPYDGPVYHIEVDGEAFLAPVLVHNSKLKAMKELRVRVVDKKRGGRGAWVYTVALSDGSIIGRTFATGIDADIGDVLEIRVAEVKVKREGDRLVFTWDNPVVHSKKPRDTAVTTPQQAMELARLRRTRPDFSELSAEMFAEEEELDAELLEGVSRDAV